MQTQLDFLIENIEVKKGMEGVFVLIDPVYNRIRFSKPCQKKLKGFKQGSEFVLGIGKDRKTILIPKQTPEGTKTFKVCSNGYTSTPQLFAAEPFKSMKESIRFQYYREDKDFYIFKMKEEKKQNGSPIFYV